MESFTVYYEKMEKEKADSQATYNIQEHKTLKRKNVDKFRDAIKETHAIYQRL
jgi:hypothetical protein